LRSAMTGSDRYVSPAPWAASYFHSTSFLLEKA